MEEVVIENGEVKKPATKKPPEKWHRFQAISCARYILRGTSSIIDKRFKPLSRGKQASAPCVAWLVFAQLIEPRDWTPNSVNRVLDYGDRLYRTSHTINRVREDVYMTTSLLHPEFFIGDYKCKICVEPGFVFGNLKCEAVGAPILADGLTKFIDAGSPGVLTTQGMSFGIWKHPKCGFFLFDPSPVDEKGKRDNHGFSCIIRSNEIDDILDAIMENLDQKHDSRYCIDKVNLVNAKPIARGKYSQCGGEVVVDKKTLQTINPVDTENTKLDCTKAPPKHASTQITKTNQEAIQKVPLTIEITNYKIEAKFAAMPLADQYLADERYDYEDVRANVPTTLEPLPEYPEIAILHGWTHETSEPYKAKGAQSVVNCVMAFGFKKVHPVRTWLRTYLDEILTMGDAIYAEVKAANSSIKAMTSTDLNLLHIKVEGKKFILLVDLLTVGGTILSKSPVILSLKQGLEEFFLHNTDGVLEISSMPVAIWTEEDYFYLFDSKACDMIGFHLPENKGKKGKKDKGDTAPEKKLIGKCCVMRFLTLAGLTSHILKTLGNSKANDRYTIRRIQVVNDVPGMCEWNMFRPAAEGKSWILSGTLNADDSTFPDHSRNKQGLAISVAALVAAKMIPASKCSKDDVDNIVFEGDDFFHWCVPMVQKEEGEPEDMNLTVRNLKKVMYYDSRRATLDVKESIIIGDLLPNPDDDQPNLKDGLNEFFKNYDYGVIEFQNQFIAVWKIEEELKDKSMEIAYYLFHEYPKEKFLQQLQPNDYKLPQYACILRFLDINEIATLLTETWGPEEEEGDPKTNFSIHEIKLASISEQMSHEDIEADKAKPIKPDLHNYSALGDTGAILLGSFNQANEILFKKETRDKQQASIALVGLAMTLMFDPHLWYLQVVDDILKMGDKLTKESAANISPDEDLGTGRGFLVPTEVNHEFSLGVNPFTVEVDDESAGGKSDELVKSLEEIFTNYRMGVFRQNQNMLAIWRGQDVYFTMDPRGKQNGVAAVYWFLDLESLADALLNFSDTTDIEFIIDGIQLTNNYTEPEPDEEDQGPPIDAENIWHGFSKAGDGIWKIACTPDPEKQEAKKRALEQQQKKEKEGEPSPKGEKPPEEETTDEPPIEEEDPNKESAAICIMAIVFSKVYEPRHLNVDIVEEIIVTGKTLHAHSAERIGEDRTFQPKDIISEFFIANRRISLSIEDCVQSGKLAGNGPKIQDIIEGVEKFFKKHVSGCVTIAANANLAIWICDNWYYLFEPDAFLMCFEEISLLAEQLGGYGEGASDYEIISVDVLDWNKSPPWKFDPSAAVRPSNLPPLNAYSRLPGKARAILRGHNHQASEVFPESVRGQQTAANCIVALTMSVIKNSVTWTRKTLDEILVLGVNLHRETLKYTTISNSTLKPKDIVRIFHIGVNVMAADVEEATVTGIVAIPPPEPEDKGGKKKKKKAPAKKGAKKAKGGREPPPPPPPILLEEGLNKFFKNNNAGILSTGRFMVAIWRDSGVYFMYDPRSRNKEGKRDDDDLEGRSCVAWFACIEPLFNLISTNINDDEKYGKFQICRVIVRTVQLEPLPAPAEYKAIDESALRVPKAESDCPTPPVLPAELRQRLQITGQYNVNLSSSFERLDKELSVLLGTTHMDQLIFCAENRGFQSTAIACVANVVASMHAPSTWTPDLVDAVIKHGNILQTECTRMNRTGSRNLSPCELLDVFVVGDVRAQVRYHLNLAAGITLERDLATSLEMFFASSNAFGIMHTANYAIAVMEHWGKFYFLDPTERNKFKKNSFEGAACLIKCDTLAKLTKVIVNVCSFKEPTVYTLSAVKVQDLHFFTR